MPDELGERMKGYERASAPIFMRGLPICLRIDGRNFSSYTRRMERPFSASLHEAMVATATTVLSEVGASIAYTQSDEISLIIMQDNPKSQPWAGGKPHKMVSLVASLATVAFNAIMAADHGAAMFDARAWVVPSVGEARNYLLWRERDATKNSISMAARSVYSHKALHKKTASEMQEMLFAKGINWNDYPPGFKSGTYLCRSRVMEPFTPEELEALPEKHHARADPNLAVERTRQRVVHRLADVLAFGSFCEEARHAR